MIGTILVVWLLALQPDGRPASDRQRGNEKAAQNAAKSTHGKTTEAEPDDDEDAPASRLVVKKPPVSQLDDGAPDETALLQIRRVYVDRLTGGETAAQLRDLIITALQGTKLFVITENEERADAFLRGAGEDLLFTDKFTSSDGLSAHTNGSDSSNSSGGSGGYHSGIGRSKSLGASISENESTHIEERKHEAMASVRLVNKDGDVIWSTTQESLGGKFRGASADVADRIAKALAADIERARKLRRLP